MAEHRGGRDTSLVVDVVLHFHWVLGLGCWSSYIVSRCPSRHPSDTLEIARVTPRHLGAKTGYTEIIYI